MSLAPIDMATAREIVDFSGGDQALEPLGRLQLDGAVALYNMIADSRVGIGYLADEVGMGKTYVALGVVALMRYFNPALRVLYICPSNNVQEKWYAREYRSFAKHNVKVNQYRIRTPDGKPAAPRISCRNVRELLRAATSGYFADFFVGMGAFSIGLADDETEDKRQWREKLQELESLVPAGQFNKIVREKRDVKDQFAKALNYVLPTFDLVVIDEAHNFKHDFRSSDRNYVLSAVLGFREEAGLRSRVSNALLLSATPYDRNLNQLRNQLNLVGKGDLLPESMDAQDESHQSEVRNCLSKFLVRRLNEIDIGGKSHTRNMYRREWRFGARAEVNLDTDEQKLVTALVQKKVGEMLEGADGKPSFQTGLLASFESYGESTKSPVVEFDGDVTERTQKDAQDKNVIGALRDSYVAAELGTTLPHPKMDMVTKNVAKDIFEQGRKQIVFVRRVKSVKEIKDKLDDHYNDWLRAYIRDELAGHPDALQMMENLFAEYQQQSRRKDADIAGGEFQVRESGEAEDEQPPANDTFFSWFFRGALEPAQVKLTTQISPEAMRRGLAARNQVISSLLEINWAREICRYRAESLDDICTAHGAELSERANSFTTGQFRDDRLEEFQASQLGFLDWYSQTNGIAGIQQLVDYLRPRVDRVTRREIPYERLREKLDMKTIFDAIDDVGLSDQVYPIKTKVISALFSDDGFDLEQIQTMDMHRYLFSLCLRTGHGIIDLYLARLRQGPADLNEVSRSAWMDDFAHKLREQSKVEGFNTWHELYALADQLDLIIKSNLPEAYDKSLDEYRMYLSRELNPVQPFMGASGATIGTRSAQARKFRMPGYPLGLISTDVFQEGEDLHTFCDSVVHYGLSGSPVHIEQKTGRVDRIASRAQRRLLSFENSDAVTDEHLIQVTFPFVKESIEVLQVRQLCRNLNAFLMNLHDIGSKDFETDDTIDAARELVNRSEIPEQIREPLQSPYVPTVEEHSAEYNQVARVQAEADRVQGMSDHVASLLQDCFGRPVLETGTGVLTTPDGADLMSISLTSARASGEMLLKAFRESHELELHGMKRETLRKLMVEESWHRFSRTYVVPIAKRTYRVDHDAELLIGEGFNTHRGEIERFFERFTAKHDPADYRKPSAKMIRQYWTEACEKGVAQYGQLEARVAGREAPDHLLLSFSFGVEPNRRKHRVRVYELADRCIFLAMAVGAEDVEQLNVDQIVRFTWERNANIDVVEFMMNDAGEIVGRAVQPIEGLSLRKFSYCAYTLAASTDRLEYIIQEPDRY